MYLLVNKMIISEKLNTIIRILLANYFKARSEITLSELAKDAKISNAMAKRLVLRLEKTGYVKIRSRIKLIKPTKLMKAWGYLYSMRELERLEFVLAERPQYAILKIANWARAKKINYAFTLFSATEKISPYVAPSNTYLYIHKNDIPKWEDFFKEEGVLPAEKEGNIICLVVDDDYFKGVWNVRGSNIVSLPQLYADLMSMGGRAEEAAQELEKLINKLNNKGDNKNV